MLFRSLHDPVTQPGTMPESRVGVLIVTPFHEAYNPALSAMMDQMVPENPPLQQMSLAAVSSNKRGHLKATTL